MGVHKGLQNGIKKETTKGIQNKGVPKRDSKGVRSKRRHKETCVGHFTNHDILLHILKLKYSNVLSSAMSWFVTPPQSCFCEYIVTHVSAHDFTVYAMVSSYLLD